MKGSSLVRFGVALEGPLLAQLDALVGERGCTRSELFRDMARAEVARSKVARGVPSVASLTIVYDHHARDLGEKLTELQHELGDGVRATMHVHLSHDYCLEVIVMRGPSHELQTIASRILGMRGVKHGGIEIVSESWEGAATHARAGGKGAHAPGRHAHAPGRHAHAPGVGAHGHAVTHALAPRHAHAPAPRPGQRPTRKH